MKATPISPNDSTSAADQVSFPYQMGVENPTKQVEDEYNALAAAVKSGNITNAQNALAALQKTKQDAIATGAIESQSPVSQLSANFLTLQNALKAGDVSKAQKAFAAVDQIIQSGFTASIATAQSAAPISVSAPQPVVNDQPSDTSSTGTPLPGSVFSTQA